ncbi:hypothetical protein BDR06DRAFT_950005 [Suillus hirtellus]|nr:hypothetical protein BDR06DRAFT_950005 [Suillus hirtellus]
MALNCAAFSFNSLRRSDAILTMVGNCRHIPAAIKQQWVTMSAQMKPKAIARVTDTSHRTINRVLRLSRLAGSIVKRPLESGCPRALSGACRY